MTVFLDDGVAADRPALAVPLSLPGRWACRATHGPSARRPRRASGGRRTACELGGATGPGATPCHKLRAVDAAPARWRGGVGGAPTHRSISTQVRRAAAGAGDHHLATRGGGAAAAYGFSRGRAARPGPRTRARRRRGTRAGNDAVGPGPAHQYPRGQGTKGPAQAADRRPRVPAGLARALGSRKAVAAVEWTPEQRGLMSTPGPE